MESEQTGLLNKVEELLGRELSMNEWEDLLEIVIQTSREISDPEVEKKAYEDGFTHGVYIATEDFFQEVRNGLSEALEAENMLDLKNGVNNLLDYLTNIKRNIKNNVLAH